MAKKAKAKVSSPKPAEVVEDFNEVLKEFVVQDPGNATPVSRRKCSFVFNSLLCSAFLTFIEVFYALVALLVSALPLRIFTTPKYDLNVKEVCGFSSSLTCCFTFCTNSTPLTFWL